MNKIDWTDKNAVLQKLNNYIKSNNDTLVGSGSNQEWRHILDYCNKFNYDIKKLCSDLGYDYWKLKGKNLPINYYKDYSVLRNTILNFIKEYGYFPQINELKNNYNVPPTVIQKHGGIEKIKNDIGYVGNDLVDESGFRNRSHYEYIVAQFLIHNNIPYKREQHPFPKPYQNLRSDFMFEESNGNIWHLEVWGYRESDVDGKRSQEYCKNKEQKIDLYNRYGINLISIENNVFENTFNDIQKKLSSILSPILKVNLKPVPHEFLINPNKLTDDDLFAEIMKLSQDDFTLPSESEFTSDNKNLFYEALRRFGNYTNFANHYGVVTNNKHKYWNEENVQNRLLSIHEKYKYLPTSIEIRNNKLSKQDKLFIGIVDATKTVYKNTIKAYLTFYESCVKNGRNLGVKDIEYLTNLYNLKYFRKDKVSQDDRDRAYNILLKIN